MAEILEGRISKAVSQWKSRAQAGRRQRRYQDLRGPHLGGKIVSFLLSTWSLCGRLSSVPCGLSPGCWGSHYRTVWRPYLVFWSVSLIMPSMKWCVGSIGRANRSEIRSMESGWERLAKRYWNLKHWYWAPDGEAEKSHYRMVTEVLHQNCWESSS